MQNAVKEKLVKILASFFYLGYFPIAPGTVGSVAGVAIYLLVKHNTVTHAVSMLFLLCVGFLIVGKAEKKFGEKYSKLF